MIWALGREGGPLYSFPLRQAQVRTERFTDLIVSPILKFVVRGGSASIVLLSCLVWWLGEFWRENCLAPTRAPRLDLPIEARLGIIVVTLCMRVQLTGTRR